MRHDCTAIRADRLQRVPGMASLPRQTRTQIDALSTELRILAGQTLIRRGNPGRQTFLITEGMAAVRVNGSIVATRTPGDLIGEVAVLQRCPRNADVVALSAMTVLVMSPAELVSLCEDQGFRVWLDLQLGAHAASA
jgi:CRP-like cAMP-binding protein